MANVAERRRWRTHAVLFLALALSVSACSSGGGTS
jgi:hypothetical protein